MSADLASATATLSIATLELGELHIQELLRSFGWSYCVIWLQTPAGRLSCCYHHINNEKADDPLLFSSLEHYVCCTLSLEMGFAGAAMRNGRHIWVSGTGALQSPVPQQARFFRDASIQTVVCTPYASGVLELGTTDAVQEDHEFVLRIRRSFSPTAGPVLGDGPAFVATPIGSEDVPYRDDTGSSNSNSSHSEFATTGLSPGLSSPTMADYALDIFEQLNMDRHTVNRTLVNLPTADMALRYCTSLPSSLSEAPSNVSLAQAHNLNRLTGPVIACAPQELSIIPLDDHSMTPMDVELCPSRGSFRTKPEPASAALAREIHGFSSFHMNMDRKLTAQNLAYIQNPSENFDGLRSHDFSRETSTSTSAFKPWTATMTSSQSGTEKITGKSLWRTWLRYVLPQMKSRRTSPAIQPKPAIQSLGTQDAFIAQAEAARQHMMAERTRRGKQNDCFRTLRLLNPTLRKKDKVTVLEHTIKYMQHLKERVQELEEQNTQHLYAFASHQSPETGEDARSANPRQTAPEITVPAGSVLSELPRVEVTYNAANGVPLFQIELAVAFHKQARDTLINVLTVLKGMKLTSVEVNARYERNSFTAKLTVAHEDDGTSIPHPDEIQEVLRSVV